MKRALTIGLVATALVALAAFTWVRAAAPASKPATRSSAPASTSAASKPALTHAHVFAGHDYYSVVLRSKDIAKFTVAATRLRNLAVACEAYAMDNDDRYPPSLDALIKGNYGLTADSIQSPVNPEKTIVYVPGARSGNSDRIIAFDPVSYDGKVQVLFADGHVQAMTENEFTKAVENLK